MAQRLLVAVTTTVVIHLLFLAHGYTQTTLPSEHDLAAARGNLALVAKHDNSLSYIARWASAPIETWPNWSALFNSPCARGLVCDLRAVPKKQAGQRSAEARVETEQNAANQLSPTIHIDGVTYPYTAAGLNRAISHTISLGGGTVDATGMRGDFRFTDEVEVGSSASKPVVLILSPSAHIGCDISDPSKYCFRLFDNGTLIGGFAPGTGQGTTIGSASSSNNVRGIIGTDDSLGQIKSTFKLEGIHINNVVGGTLADAALVIRGTKDNSVVRNCLIVNPSGIGIHIGGTTLNAGVGVLTIEDTWINGSNGATDNTTALPLYINCNATCGTVGAIRWISGSIVDPGLGHNAILIDGGGYFYASAVGLFGIHMEGSINPSETTTPLIRMTNFAGNLSIVGGEALYSFGENFTVQVDSGSNGLGIMNMRTGHTNQVHNMVTGVDAIGPNGNIGYYTDSTTLIGPLVPTTVSSLPPASPANAGQMMRVSDWVVSVEGYACVGGGTATALAFSNGSVWKCF